MAIGGEMAWCKGTDAPLLPRIGAASPASGNTQANDDATNGATCGAAGVSRVW